MGIKFGILVLAAVVAIAASVLTGCGGGGSSSSSNDATSANPATSGNAAATDNGAAAGSSKVLTKAEFVTKMDGICSQVPATFSKLYEAFQKTGKHATKAELNQKTSLPPLYTAVKGMQALTPPPAETQKLEKTIAALNAAIKGLEENPNASFAGPKTPFTELQKVSKTYGFEKCAGL
jgi:hypothetical protein